MVLAHGEEGFLEVAHKLLPQLRVHAVEEGHVLVCEFEGRRLEGEVARAHAEDKAKVDVDYVAVRVEQDVTVVAVLELQHILHHAVPRQALREIPLRQFERS